MAQVSQRFVDETLWPEFQQISETLRTYLSEITDWVVSKVIYQDSSEAEVVKEQPLIQYDNIEAATEADTLPLTAKQDTASGDMRTQTKPKGSRRKRKKQKKGQKKR